MSEKMPVFVMLGPRHNRTHFAWERVPGRYWETFCGQSSKVKRPFILVDLPSEDAPLCRHCAIWAANREADRR